METINMSSVVDQYNSSAILLRVKKHVASISKASDLATNAAQDAVGNDNGGYTGSVMLPDLNKQLNKHYQRGRRLVEAKGREFLTYHCVPITRYKDVRDNFTEIEGDFMSCVHAWTGDAAKYGDYKALCEKLHEGLWSENLLPEHREDYERQFALKLLRCAMPSTPSEDMMVILDQDAFEMLKEDIAEDAHVAYRGLIGAGVRDLLEQLEAIAKRMGVQDQKFTAKTFNALRNECEKLGDFAKIEGSSKILKIITVTEQVIDSCEKQKDTLNAKDASGTEARTNMQKQFEALREHLTKAIPQ